MAEWITYNKSKINTILTPSTNYLYRNEMAKISISHRICVFVLTNYFPAAFNRTNSFFLQCKICFFLFPLHSWKDSEYSIKPHNNNIWFILAFNFFAQYHHFWWNIFILHKYLSELFVFPIFSIIQQLSYRSCESFQLSAFEIL